jgi:hypothetical protein
MEGKKQVAMPYAKMELFGQDETGTVSALQQGKAQLL